MKEKTIIQKAYEGNDFKLPKNSIKYILFQRTGYMKNNLFFRFLTHFGYHKLFYKLSVYLKSFFFSDKIKTAFSKNIADEYSLIKKYLPEKAESILDIGCGVAGIDILLSRHYNNDVDIFLIDKTTIDKKVYYNFEKRGSFYNSLQISKSVLILNGVDNDRIHLQEATENNEIKFSHKFDIIISLFSCGFHYPVSTYLDEIYRKLSNKDGILILDIRKNTNGEKDIEKKFGNYQIICEGEKHIRILARRKKV